MAKSRTSGLAAFEIVTFPGLAAKAGASLASKSIYQISTSAMARETARKGANYFVQKTATLAAEKRIAQKSVQGVSKRGLKGTQRFSKQINTNPFKGPVSQDVMIVDLKGNILPVRTGQRLTGSPDGKWL